LWLRDGIIRCWVFVPCNSENISCRTFLKYKNSRKHELALWHLVKRLFPENAKYCSKVHIKHVGIQTKQAWSIKNYRYVCNVSVCEVVEKNNDWLGSYTGPHTKEVWTSMQLGCATRIRSLMVLVHL